MGAIQRVSFETDKFLHVVFVKQLHVLLVEMVAQILVIQNALVVEEHWLLVHLILVHAYAVDPGGRQDVFVPIVGLLELLVLEFDSVDLQLFQCF